MARSERAREGLLHQIVGVGAGPATGETLQQTRVRVQLGGELLRLHGEERIAAAVPRAISRSCRGERGGA
jgi:hypothetical protein